MHTLPFLLWTVHFPGKEIRCRHTFDSQISWAYSTISLPQTHPWEELSSREIHISGGYKPSPYLLILSPTALSDFIWGKWCVLSLLPLLSWGMMRSGFLVSNPRRVGISREARLPRKECWHVAERAVTPHDSGSPQCELETRWCLGGSNWVFIGEQFRWGLGGEAAGRGWPSQLLFASYVPACMTKQGLILIEHTEKCDTQHTLSIPGAHSFVLL